MPITADVPPVPPIYQPAQQEQGQEYEKFYLPETIRRNPTLQVINGDVYAGGSNIKSYLYNTALIYKWEGEGSTWKIFFEYSHNGERLSLLSPFAINEETVLILIRKNEEYAEELELKIFNKTENGEWVVQPGGFTTGPSSSYMASIHGLTPETALVRYGGTTYLINSITEEVYELPVSVNAIVKGPQVLCENDGAENTIQCYQLSEANSLIPVEGFEGLDPDYNHFLYGGDNDFLAIYSSPKSPDRNNSTIFIYRFDNKNKTWQIETTILDVPVTMGLFA